MERETEAQRVRCLRLHYECVLPWGGGSMVAGNSFIKCFIANRILRTEVTPAQGRGRNSPAS